MWGEGEGKGWAPSLPLPLLPPTAGLSHQRCGRLPAGKAGLRGGGASRTTAAGRGSGWVPRNGVAVAAAAGCWGWRARCWAGRQCRRARRCETAHCQGGIPCPLPQARSFFGDRGLVLPLDTGWSPAQLVVAVAAYVHAQQRRTGERASHGHPSRMGPVAGESTQPPWTPVVVSHTGLDRSGPSPLVKKLSPRQERKWGGWLQLWRTRMTQSPVASAVPMPDCDCTGKKLSLSHRVFVQELT